MSACYMADPCKWHTQHVCVQPLKKIKLRNFMRLSKEEPSKLVTYSRLGK